MAAAQEEAGAAVAAAEGAVLKAQDEAASAHAAAQSAAANAEQWKSRCGPVLADILNLSTTSMCVSFKVSHAAQCKTL